MGTIDAGLYELVKLGRVAGVGVAAVSASGEGVLFGVGLRWGGDGEAPTGGERTYPTPQIDRSTLEKIWGLVFDLIPTPAEPSPGQWFRRIRAAVHPHEFDP